MVSEREIIIAFVFIRSGKKEMGFSEFNLTLSVALNRFTPEDAKVFTKKAVENIGLHVMGLTPQEYATQENRDLYSRE